MKKTTIYTNHFSPENFGINDIAKKISEEHNVEIITQIPNYPKGSYFKGYGIFKKRKESINDSLIVRRLFAFPRMKNKIGLVLNYFSYILSSSIFSLFFQFKKTDVVFAYITSPIFISWAAIRHAKRQNAQLVMYLLDFWPDNLISMLNIKNKHIVNYFNRICQRIYMQFDIIYISSESFRNKLLELGVSSNKIVLLYQHHLDAEKDVELITNRISNKKVNILFTGNIGEAQGLNLLIDLSKILKKNSNNDFHFNIVGDGRYKKEFIANLNKEQLQSYFSIYDRVEPSELHKFYNSNTFGLVILKNNPIINLHLPAKVQGYMSNGVPILAFASGEVENTVIQSNSGVVINNGNIEDMYSKLIGLSTISDDQLQNYSISGKRFARQNFSLNETLSIFQNNLNVLNSENIEENPLVSIITPMYNSEKFISETIESVINQSYSNFEMLIVDDLSTDKSVDIVTKYSNQDNRIKLFSLEDKGGAAAARNLATNFAKGDYIAFLDADDLWDSNKLMIYVNEMKKNNYDFVYSDYRQIDESGNKLNTIRIAPAKLTYKRLLYVSSSIGCLTAMYNVNKIGKINVPKLKKRNDIAIWQRILFKRNKGTKIEGVHASYRIVPNSLSRNIGKISMLEHHYILYRENLKFGVVKSVYYSLFNGVTYFVVKLFYEKKSSL